VDEGEAVRPLAPTAEERRLAAAVREERDRIAALVLAHFAMPGAEIEHDLARLLNKIQGAEVSG
jgi:hypothetical protein